MQRALTVVAAALLAASCNPSARAPRLSEVHGAALHGGRPIDAAALPGRVVVVNFFGSWCGPCRGEEDGLAAAARQFRAEGVSFLGVAEREHSRINATVFLRQHHINYPVIYDDSGDVIARVDAGIGIPTTLIFDRGHLARRFSGAVLYAELAAALRDQIGNSNRVSVPIHRSKAEGGPPTLRPATRVAPAVGDRRCDPRLVAVKNRRRGSYRLAALCVLDDAEEAIRSRRARMAAGAALALALDGSTFGWALGNLHGSLAWTTFAFSGLTILAATFGVAIAVARLDRRLAKIRRIRRLLEFAT